MPGLYYWFGLTFLGSECALRGLADFDAGGSTAFLLDT